MLILIGPQQHSLVLTISRPGPANSNTPWYPLAFSSVNKNIPCPDNILVLPTTTLCCIYLHSVMYTRLKHIKCQTCHRYSHSDKTTIMIYSLKYIKEACQIFIYVSLPFIAINNGDKDICGELIVILHYLVYF